jgi:hypothetical protein
MKRTTGILCRIFVLGCELQHVAGLIGIL